MELWSCLKNGKGYWNKRVNTLYNKFLGENGKCVFFFKFIYLFLAVLGLHFRARALSSRGERGPLFIAVCGPLTVAASLAAEHRLQMRRLSSCGSRAQLLHGMWDLLRPGLEPVFPALAGRFSTTAPPGKPGKCVFCFYLKAKGTFWPTQYICVSMSLYICMCF